MRVGDTERQTAVGEALAGIVHPLAVDRCGANIDGVAIDDIGGEIHGAFHGFGDQSESSAPRSGTATITAI